MWNQVVNIFLATSLIQLTKLAIVEPRQIEPSDLFNIKNDREDLSDSVCGYSSCPSTDPNRINVHIIAHTHDDVGWLKTVDQYYYGTKKHYSPVGVQHILDSVIPQLVMDKSKRFIYVEMSFFSKWWNEQDEKMKSIVKRLVNEGRFEFINGGWCMNDEATVTYQSTVEQMTLGLKFLNETFGQCALPKVGWQIDPFGHTSEQASIFAQIGFDGMFFTRIGYRDKNHRIQSKSLDLIWHGDRLLSGQSGSIFTNIFREGYDAPNGYCFDVLCMDDNLVDNKKSFEFNIDAKGERFIQYIRDYAQNKLTNQLLIPLGGDFQFSAAGQNFKNIDKLIKYIRSKAPNINIFYSTPSCYQFAVHQVVANDNSLRLPEKFDDFMPYDSGPTVWWSGYFSSRPTVKLIERQIADLLQVTRLVSMANLLKSQGDKSWSQEVKDHESKCLMPLWEILGDLQHHDAVTGTEKQHVADDYVRRAVAASVQCSNFIGDLRRLKLNEYLKKSPKYELSRESGKRFKLDPVYLETTMLCPLLNISQCDPLESKVDYRRYLNLTETISGKSTSANQQSSRSNPGNTKSAEFLPELETKSVLLNIYNSLARPISQHDIRLPCNDRCDLDKVRVVHLSTNETMKLIRLPVPSGISSLPFRQAQTRYEILFYANVPALGYTSFVIEDTNNEEIVDEESEQSDSIVITDEHETKKAILNRRIRNDEPDYEYFPINVSNRLRRESSFAQQDAADKVIVKFDMSSGMIVGLKRVSDGSILNITQKFGYYFPSNYGEPPGAYIFRPNTSEPYLLDKPSLFKVYKRKNGALIEIHQKWASWLWQTIRVDAKKNYIEFDYVVGPIPVSHPIIGREVVTRYITNMQNRGVFLTDSNARQLLTRRRMNGSLAEQTGGSFYPVVSTIMLKKFNATKCNRCSAEAVAVLVDRAQAGTSLNEGQIELLVHRRQLVDDNFGVGEALDEPGEDGLGLVTRGKHRLYLKFQDRDNESTGSRDKSIKKSKMQLFKLKDTPRQNLTYEREFNEQRYYNKSSTKPTVIESISTFIAHDQVYNDLRQESVRLAYKPILTFDRLRVSASDFIEMIASDGNTKVKTDLNLLNTSLPANVHLLTLQPLSGGNNEVLIRLENLDNPLTIHPFPNYDNYESIVQSYKVLSDYYEEDSSQDCSNKLRTRVEVDIEYLIKRIRIVSLEELNLSANQRLKDITRLNWTDESYESPNCDSDAKSTIVRLAPRQIRTYLARFEFL